MLATVMSVASPNRTRVAHHGTCMVRLTGVMRRVLAGTFGIALGVLGWTSALTAQEITGIARVIDGDTIEIVNRRIHLHGIDAPEAKQTCTRRDEEWRCGWDAVVALHDKIGRKPVRCLQENSGRDGAIVAKCFFAEEDIGEWLILNGWAVAKAPDGRDYARVEAVARSVRRGIWAGDRSLNELF